MNSMKSTTRTRPPAPSLILSLSSKLGAAVLAPLLCASIAQATPQTYVTTIEQVAPNIGYVGFEKAIVWLGDGRTMQIALSSPEGIELQERTMRIWLESERRNFWEDAKSVRVTYDEDTILELESTKEPLSAGATLTWENAYSDYQPTVFNVEADAQVFMDRLLQEPVRHKSECWQRAHYWNHTLWRDFSVKSNKTFLFYSEVYRELDPKENFWKFHVAPSITMANGDEMVLDAEFNPTVVRPDGRLSRSAVYRDEWSQKFVNPKRPCVHLNSYAEFKRRDKNRENEYCYLITVPMYYWGPDNLDSGEFSAIVDTWEAYSIDKTCKAIKASQCGHWTFENEDSVTKWKRAHAKPGVEFF